MASLIVKHITHTILQSCIPAPELPIHDTDNCHHVVPEEQLVLKFFLPLAGWRSETVRKTDQREVGGLQVGRDRQLVEVEPLAEHVSRPGHQGGVVGRDCRLGGERERTEIEGTEREGIQCNTVQPAENA